jgi:Trk K+ transport system NAD-binding subunit
VVVFGLGRYGARLLRGLEAAGFSVLGADFDPEQTRALRGEGLSVRYGDVTEPSFLDELSLAQTRWVVSALPDLASNRSLIAALREHGFCGATAVVAREAEDQAILESLGVDSVLVPVTDAVDRAVDTLRMIMQQERQRA